MKARIPLSKRLSKAARQAVAEYKTGREQTEFFRWLKLACLTLHERFGFGHDRLADFLGGVTKLAKERETDEIYWFHVDKIVIERLNLPFERENYEEVDR